MNKLFDTKDWYELYEMVHWNNRSVITSAASCFEQNAASRFGTLVSFNGGKKTINNNLNFKIQITILVVGYSVF